MLLRQGVGNSKMKLRDTDFMDKHLQGERQRQTSRKRVWQSVVHIYPPSKGTKRQTRR